MGGMSVTFCWSVIEWPCDACYLKSRESLVCDPKERCFQTIMFQDQYETSGMYINQPTRVVWLFAFVRQQGVSGWCLVLEHVLFFSFGRVCYTSEG